MVLLGKCQHLKSSDVPMYAGVVPGGDPPDETWEDFSAEVPKVWSLCKPVEQFGLKEIDRSVGVGPRGIGYLLVESDDDPGWIRLDNPARLRRRRIKGHHREGTTLWALMPMGRYESTKIASAPVVRMSH